MATTVSMPQLGETVTEGTILKWGKKVGDSIAADETLVEISTDKVDTEVPSPVSGTILEILVEEGSTVAVGVPLVVIGEAGEAPATGESEGDSEGRADEAPESEEVAAEAPATQKPAAEEPIADEPLAEESADDEPAAEESAADEPLAEEPAPEAQRAASLAEVPGDSATDEGEMKDEPTDEEVEAFFAEPESGQLLSPVVRRLIREHSLDLSSIKGTGQGGRVTRQDVETAIEAGSKAPEPAAPQPTPAPTPAPVAEATPEEPAPTETEAPSSAPKAVQAAAPTTGEEVELDRLRVRIAENMVKSLQTAAHVWTSVEVDYERVERVRQKHRDRFKAEEGFSLTYLPFIARATIDALKAYPVVNSSFYLEEKKAVFHKNVDLGIAIDLNGSGLIVARVRNADGLRLVGLAREVRTLAEKGRAGKLSLDELTGSTFTITNPGPFGSFMSAPVINLPNVAILSTETVAKRPSVITAADGQDMIAIRHIGYLGLTWDHRAFDGSTAVLFLGRIKENLETWDWEQELA